MQNRNKNMKIVSIVGITAGEYFPVQKYYNRATHQTARIEYDSGGTQMTLKAWPMYTNAMVWMCSAMILS